MDIKALYEEFLPRDEIKDILKSYFLQGYNNNVYELMSDIFDDKFDRIFFVLFPDDVNSALTLNYIHNYPFSNNVVIKFEPAIFNIIDKAVCWRAIDDENKWFMFEELLASPSDKELLRDVGIDLDKELKHSSKNSVFNKLNKWFNKMPINKKLDIGADLLNSPDNLDQFDLLLIDFINSVRAITDIPDNIYTKIKEDPQLKRSLSECFFIKQSPNDWSCYTKQFVLKVLNNCFNLQAAEYEELLSNPTYHKIIEQLDTFRLKANRMETLITEGIGFNRYNICKQIINNTNIPLTTDQLARRYKYISSNSSRVGFCKTENKIKRIGVYALVNNLYSEELLLHECIHALSYNDRTDKIGYHYNNNSWLNEVITQFVTLKILSNTNNTSLYPYSNSTYTNGCYLIWDFLEEYEDLIKEDFMGINTLFLDKIGESNFLQLSDLLKTFFEKFNISTECSHIRQFNGLELKNVREILAHRDELEGQNIDDLDKLYKHIDKIRAFTRTLMPNVKKNVVNNKSI